MTGLIPRPFIDELLNRTDIVELIDSHVPLKHRGNSHTACCPFHNEKTPSFNVNAKKQFYHCFGCGVSGNAISFIMQHLNFGFVEAIENLAARVGMQVPREGNSSQDNQSKNLYQLLQQVANFYQKILKESGQLAIEYLKSRGVTGEIARLYQLGYAPPAWQTISLRFKSSIKELIATGMLIEKSDGSTYDRYRQRVTYPIHDRHGRIIGFGGRSLEAEQKPKYLNSPETVLFQKSRELYGLHQVLQQSTSLDTIIVVEGYMDVIALAQYGIMNAVATLGTATSTYHIQLLSKHTRHIIFCFDGDDAGRQAAWRALESSLPHLNAGLEAQFIFLPEGHDPDSLVREEGKEHFLERLKKATPLNHYFYSTLTQNLDIGSLAGKSQLVLAAKPHLLRMNDGPYKQLMIDELARLTRIEPHRILQMLVEPSSEKAEANFSIARSPTRTAIALLLQHPEIYAANQNQLHTNSINSRQYNVLHTLMQQIAENPSINTANLVESWRNSSMFEAINKLAAWDHQVPEEALTREFLEIVLFLGKQSREHEIQELLKKSRTEGLSDIEKLNLQNLLKQRHEI